MKRAPDNVRYLGQFGEDILTRSLPPVTPKQKSARWVREGERVAWRTTGVDLKRHRRAVARDARVRVCGASVSPASGESGPAQEARGFDTPDLKDAKPLLSPADPKSLRSSEPSPPPTLTPP